MELLCRHKVHTDCALREMAAHDALNLRCPSCRDFVVPRQIMEETEAVHGEEGQREVIRYFWDHEPNFKAGLEGIRDARVAAQRANVILGRKERELANTLETETAPLVAQIHSKVAATKAAWKALPEKKEVDRLSRVYVTKNTHFGNRWGARMWRIRDALGDVAAARSLIGNLYTMFRRTRSRSLRLFNIYIE